VHCVRETPPYSECGLSISAFLPTDQRQTVNTAELFASIRALGATDSAKVAICTDSSYVYGGATGSARRWKVRGWKNAKGVVVSNPALWDLLINELDRPGRVVQWVKIPSHVGIEGNTEADRLANIGRESSPLYPKRTTSGPTTSHGTQPLSKRRKINIKPAPLASPTPRTTQPLRKKRKIDIENAPPASPFLTADESLELLDSLGLVPLSDSLFDPATDSDSNTTFSDDLAYLSPETASTVSTDSGYASTC